MVLLMDMVLLIMCISDRTCILFKLVNALDFKIMRQNQFCDWREWFYRVSPRWRLVEEGYKVKALSEYNSFNDIGLKDAKPNILNELEIVSGDVRDAEPMMREVRGFDCVIHLASLIFIILIHCTPILCGYKHICFIKRPKLHHENGGVFIHLQAKYMEQRNLCL